MTERDYSMLIEDDAWKIFRAHHPVGQYYPVGQLDGDCKCGRGSWPCDDVRPLLDKFARWETAQTMFKAAQRMREEMHEQLTPDMTLAWQMSASIINYLEAKGAEQLRG